MLLSIKESIAEDCIAFCFVIDLWRIGICSVAFSDIFCYMTLTENTPLLCKAEVLSCWVLFINTKVVSLEKIFSYKVVHGILKDVFRNGQCHFFF
jgi:hypothetical protein